MANVTITNRNGPVDARVKWMLDIVFSHILGSIHVNIARPAQAHRMPCAGIKFKNTRNGGMSLSAIIRPSDADSVVLAFITTPVDQSADWLYRRVTDEGRKRMITMEEMARGINGRPSQPVKEVVKEIPPVPPMPPVVPAPVPAVAAAPAPVDMIQQFSKLVEMEKEYASARDSLSTLDELVVQAEQEVRAREEDFLIAQRSLATSRADLEHLVDERKKVEAIVGSEEHARVAGLMKSIRGV